VSPALVEIPPLVAMGSGLSCTYRLSVGGEPVGALRCSWWRSRGTLTAGERTFQVTRTGEWGRPFVLLREGEEVARAYKPSFFSSRFVLHLGDETLDFRQPGLLSRDFVLSRGYREVGRVDRKGLFREHVTLTLPPEWPLPLQVFLLFLARVVWQREQAAAS
jgi:hypothetical protein